VSRLAQADIAIFGGSGFYTLAEDVEEIKVETPYGAPSDKVALATIAGRRVAFLPRHGKDHSLPPHRIPYRANLWAMKQLGVQRIIGPTAAGSLQRHIKPGEFVVCDQFVDRTTGRQDTFYDGPITTHIAGAEPYCPELRALAVAGARDLGIPVHERGTVVVVQGPRFSTKAESQWYSGQGWEVINMTQYPESWLARELGMCYVNISLITDYDAGLVGEDGIEPVTADEMLKVFAANVDHAKQLVADIVRRVPEEPSCQCAHALDNARIE
jgi:5'-methylthioadenosine phosphorylase